MCVSVSFVSIDLQMVRLHRLPPSRCIRGKLCRKVFFFSFLREKTSSKQITKIALIWKTIWRTQTPISFCANSNRVYSKKEKKKLINHKHNRFRSVALNYFIIFLSINFLVIAVSSQLTQHSCMHTRAHTKKTHTHTSTDMVLLLLLLL